MYSGPQLLAAWIERSKLKKGVVAKMIGVSAPMLSHVLGGHRKPTLPNAVQIETVTGIPVESWVPIQNGKTVRRRRAAAERAYLANG